MSNYSIVIDTSNFKPFDINIPLSVLRDYRDAYYRREDALQKIAEDIGEAQIPAPREGDREQQRIYDQYMQYQDDLKAASDDFSRGMNWKNASLISAINKRYGTEVKPIKQAVADFKTWRQNLDNIYKGDSSAIIGNEGVTAYDFLNGNMPDLKYRSGKDLRQVGEILGKAWFAAHPGKSEIVKGIFDGYVEYIQRGGDPKDAEALANAKYEAATGENPEGIQILINQVRDYVNDDMRDFSDDAKVKGFKELITGVAGAMPETRKDLKQDPNFVSDFEKRKQAFTEWISRREDARAQRKLENDIYMGRAELALKREAAKYNNGLTKAQTAYYYNNKNSGSRGGARAASNSEKDFYNSPNGRWLDYNSKINEDTGEIIRKVGNNYIVETLDSYQDGIGTGWRYIQMPDTAQVYLNGSKSGPKYTIYAINDKEKAAKLYNPKDSTFKTVPLEHVAARPYNWSRSRNRFIEGDSVRVNTVEDIARTYGIYTAPDLRVGTGNAAAGDDTNSKGKKPSGRPGARP